MPNPVTYEQQLIETILEQKKEIENLKTVIGIMRNLNTCSCCAVKQNEAKSEKEIMEMLNAAYHDSCQEAKTELLFKRQEKTNKEQPKEDVNTKLKKLEESNQLILERMGKYAFDAGQAMGEIEYFLKEHLDRLETVDKKVIHINLNNT